MPETTALGAAIAAGAAEGVDAWEINKDHGTGTTDTFTPSIRDTGELCLVLAVLVGIMLCTWVTTILSYFYRQREEVCSLEEGS